MPSRSVSAFCLRVRRWRRWPLRQGSPPTTSSAFSAAMDATSLELSVIGTEGPEPRDGGVEPFEGNGLSEAVEDLEEHPLGTHEDSELSLAGLQDKLLLVRLPDGGWGRPLGGRPSTHILKREDTRFPGLIKAEAECLAIARAVSLTTIETEAVQLGGHSCLIVSRFDRVVDADGEVRRIHQEDLCQALGLSTQWRPWAGEVRTGDGRAFTEAGGRAARRLQHQSTRGARPTGRRGRLHRCDRQRRRSRQESGASSPRSRDDLAGAAL